MDTGNISKINIKVFAPHFLAKKADFPECEGSPDHVTIMNIAAMECSDVILMSSMDIAKSKDREQGFIVAIESGGTTLYVLYIKGCYADKYRLLGHIAQDAMEQALVSAIMDKKEKKACIYVYFGKEECKYAIADPMACVIDVKKYNSFMSRLKKNHIKKLIRGEIK
jgi:hypothetical protein